MRSKTQQVVTSFIKLVLFNWKFNGVLFDGSLRPVDKVLILLLKFDTFFF